MILLEETLKRYQTNQGYVYLIHAEGTDRYKIGRSVNPVVRLEQLKVQSPYPLRIIESFWTPDAINDERRFHEQYKKSRIFGEWFELSCYSTQELNSPQFINDEQFEEKLSRSINALRDDFWSWRWEAKNISESVAFLATEVFLKSRDFRNNLAFFVKDISPEIIIKVKFQQSFYENLLNISNLQSLQLICNFGARQWAICVAETLTRLTSYKGQIELNEVNVSIRGTIAGFSACLSGVLTV